MGKRLGGTYIEGPMRGNDVSIGAEDARAIEWLQIQVTVFCRISFDNAASLVNGRGCKRIVHIHKRSQLIRIARETVT